MQNRGLSFHPLLCRAIPLYEALWEMLPVDGGSDLLRGVVACNPILRYGPQVFDLALLASGPSLGDRMGTPPVPSSPRTKELKKVMMDTLTIDVEKCTACRACELACSFTHEGVFAPQLSRIRVVRFMDRGLNVPVVCANCARPACVEACPTGAAHTDRSVPVVRIEADECIGCGECVKACPFGAADFDESKEVAYICDLCDGEPVCVTHCIYGALTYEPMQRLAQRKRRNAAEAHAGREGIP